MNEKVLRFRLESLEKSVQEIIAHLNSEGMKSPLDILGKPPMAPLQEVPIALRDEEEPEKNDGENEDDIADE